MCMARFSRRGPSDSMQCPGFPAVQGFQGLRVPVLRALGCGPMDMSGDLRGQVQVLGSSRSLEVSDFRRRVWRV